VSSKRGPGLSKKSVSLAVKVIACVFAGLFALKSGASFSEVFQTFARLFLILPEQEERIYSEGDPKE
jgi:hypothetical protein